MANGLAVVAAVVVATVHMAFLAYIVIGGFLALRGLAWLWPSIATTVYSVYVTLAGATCPLTTLEKWLLQVGGRVPYEGSFISHYLHDVLYPAQYEVAAWLTAMGVTFLSYAIVLTQASGGRGTAPTGKPHTAGMASGSRAASQAVPVAGPEKMTVTAVSPDIATVHSRAVPSSRRPTASHEDR